MLVALNHGQKMVPYRPGQADDRLVDAVWSGSSEGAPARAVLAYGPSAAGALARGKAPSPDAFGYMFEGDGVQADNPFDTFGSIGAAMADAGLPGPSGLPAILTYFGQFIDHDITANTDRDSASLPKFEIGQPRLTRNSRENVRRQLSNLRRGTLRLDSVYGDDMPIDAKLRDGPRMRIGQAGDGRPFDLPRFGPLVEAGVLAPSDLPPVSDMHSDFGPPEADKIAFIADGRNDENLVVAQLHLAVLRFHNALVERLEGTDDARFERARQLTCWHYQWLVVEQYLQALCEPAVLQAVISGDAPRYRAFAARTGGAAGAHAPLPLEFSVAAFRFGHSMIRPSYMFNDNFRAAGLRELFAFTGRGGLQGAAVLPGSWIIDWTNFIAAAPGDRVAMPIDPSLAEPLADMVNEHKPHLRSLAQRNLRRSYVLDIPSAQSVLAQLASEGEPVEPLSAAEIQMSAGGKEATALGLGDRLPLWLYILAEAAARGEGKRLGGLGSLIVAETLVGLLVVDQDSYWHAGRGGGRWSPADAALGEPPIDSFEKFFKFAGVM